MDFHEERREFIDRACLSWRDVDGRYIDAISLRSSVLHLFRLGEEAEKVGTAGRRSRDLFPWGPNVG